MSGPARVRRDGGYVIADDRLPAGSTLGGPDLCVTIKGNGTLDRVHSLRAGRTLLAGLGIRHWDLATGVRLAPAPGRVVLRPESQEHRYRLAETLLVRETVVVLDDGSADAPAACYVAVRVRNESAHPVRLASVAFGRLAATMAQADVHARYDAAHRALVIWSEDERCARALVASEPPVSWTVTSDHARAVADRWHGPFDGRIDTAGDDPLGVLHLEHELAPRATARLALVVVALPDGPESLAQTLARLPSAPDALRRTRARYDAALGRSAVLTPVGEVDLGVRWSKANMLRVMRSAPTGPGFSNDPGRSPACVGRDAAWFVHGADWIEPAFSRALLDGFAARQEPDGKIVEWYDLRTGATHDDGLDINDDTPLFILAVDHHVRSTGDASALAALSPAAERAGEQLLLHRDEHGLVRCSARGTGARGIAGWRNIIPDERISGATTEINSEAYGALRALAGLARARGDAAGARRWDGEADALRAAIERDLRNPENGLYLLCIDVDGRPRSEVTCDLLFPVIFGVADDATAGRIIGRLREPDFWTRAGLRTVPRDAPAYSPTDGHGLLGGVWVAVTFWYAFAAARFASDVVGDALASSFAHYARDPGALNTVPGQFSEWLHGETLANEGMMLSPWFPPRYLWAAIEGACGLSASFDGARVAPNIPPQWSWLAAREVPLHGAHASWLVLRMDALRVLATGALGSDLPVERFERDVTGDVTVAGDDAAVVAFARPDRTLVFVGNRANHTSRVAVVRRGALAHGRPTRRYDALRRAWSPLGEDDGAIALSIARGAFALVEFAPA